MPSECAPLQDVPKSIGFAARQHFQKCKTTPNMAMSLTSGEVVLIHKDRACAIVSVHPRSSNDRPLRVRSMCQRAPLSTTQVDSATSVRAALPSLPQTRPSLSDRVTVALGKGNRSLIPILEGPDSVFLAFSRILFNCGGHELELRRQVVATLSQEFASRLSAKVQRSATRRWLTTGLGTCKALPLAREEMCCVLQC